MANVLRITTLLGTARPGNYTGMALALVEDQLRADGAEVTAIDPARLTLEFPGRPPTADAEILCSVVKDAAGVVIATPEYHGSFAAMLKLMIENLGFPSILAGKPIALLGCAAGRIGAIKSLEQLRGVCSHVGGIVLPGPVSVANVQKVFDRDGTCLDEGVEKLVRGVSDRLLGYLRDHVCPRLTLEAMARGEDPGSVIC